MICSSLGPEAVTCGWTDIKGAGQSRMRYHPLSCVNAGVLSPSGVLPSPVCNHIPEGVNEAASCQSLAAGVQHAAPVLTLSADFVISRRDLPQPIACQRPHASQAFNPNCMAKGPMRDMTSIRDCIPVLSMETTLHGDYSVARHSRTAPSSADCADRSSQRPALRNADTLIEATHRLFHRDPPSCR